MNMHFDNFDVAFISRPSNRELSLLYVNFAKKSVTHFGLYKTSLELQTFYDAF